MPNNNCLEGVRCPKCSSDEKFDISAHTIATVTDSGTEETGDIEWNDDSECTCHACGYSGELRDFREDPEEIEKETDDCDRLDSGMKPDERGTPYTLDEVRKVIKEHKMDDHHRALFSFLVRRIERLSACAPQNTGNTTIGLVVALQRLTDADGDYYTDAPECADAVLEIAEAMDQARQALAAIK